MVEEIVQTPMFLPNTSNEMIRLAVMKVASDGQAEKDDVLEVKFLGMTHDSRDGWPMKRWVVRLHKH